MDYEGLIKKISATEAKLESIEKEREVLQKKKNELSKKCVEEFGTEDVDKLLEIKAKHMEEIKKIERDLEEVGA